MDISRSVLRWLQTIDLSQPYTNPRVDFASGFLVAEIVAHYIPTVSMHSFSNFLSVKMRTDNWNQLQKIFIANRIPINTTLVDEVIARKKGSAIKLIEILYTSFTKRTPCHAQIGDITKKGPETQSNVSLIAPPAIPKPQEEQPVEVPPVAPKRQKFIGVSSTQRNGSTPDLTPISFESASVVKSGPGFLQLRNTATPAQQPSADKALDAAIDEVTKGMTPQSLGAFAQCLDDPQHLTLLLTNYPSDMIIHFLKEAAPYFSRESAPNVIDAVAEIFIPIVDPESVSTEDLIDFIFAQPSNDPFTHHYLLYKVLEFTKPEKITLALSSFVNHETSFSQALSLFIAEKVRDNAGNDPNNLLPLVCHRLLSFDRPIAVQLISLFAPTGEIIKDALLVNLYNDAPIDSMPHIKTILSDGSRPIAAFILSKLLANEAISKSYFAGLLMILPDPKEILTEQHAVQTPDEEILIEPILDAIDPLEIAEAITANIVANKPQNLGKEIVVMSVLIQRIDSNETARWSAIFNQLHEYFYCAFSDEVICKDATDVCLSFFRLMQNEVFNTFSTLFNALNFVFPQAGCPTLCKSTATEFLTAAGDISPTFSQTILKLLMNFPPKTHPDLDKLIAHLKKVRK